MRKATLLYFFAILFILSCGPNERKPVNNEGRISYSKYPQLDNWLNYYHLELADFTDTLSGVEYNKYVYNYDLEEDSTNLLKDFFIYSPDSTHCIDLDSYYLVIEKDSTGKLVWLGNEADSEVALIDIKGKTKTRLLFCGTVCYAEQVQWITNDLIYILGYNLNDQNQVFPTIWTFDKLNNFFQDIKTKDPLNISLMDYVQKVRLKKVSFIK